MRALALSPDFFRCAVSGSTGHTGTVSDRIRAAVRVEGIVQGVGFRPFVYSLATRLGLGGAVRNAVDGVFAEVEGSRAAVEEFLFSLERDAPPLARIERVTCAAIEPAKDAGIGRQRHVR